MIPTLLNDDSFAKELGAMPRSGIAWSNIVSAADSDPQVEESLEARLGGSEHASLSNWWQQTSATIGIAGGPSATENGR